jgi:hypothetical protein
VKEIMTKPIANHDIIRKEPVVVTSADGLDSVIGLTHDEHFDLDDVSFSEEQGVVRIPYRRIFYGHPGRLIRNWLIFKTYELDVIRSILTIRNVEEYQIDDRSHIGTYSFNTMSYTNGSLLIKCCEDCDLRMVTRKLEIESRDVEVRGKSRVNYGFLWESSTGKVYE